VWGSILLELCTRKEQYGNWFLIVGAETKTFLIYGEIRVIKYYTATLLIRHQIGWTSKKKLVYEGLVVRRLHQISELKKKECA
jgi:hypothetical protein